MAELSWKEWLDLSPVPIAAKIRVPTLMVHSDGSVLPEMVRAFHAALGGPKRLVWLTGEHTEFYDRGPQVSSAVAAVREHFATQFADAR